MEAVTYVEAFIERDGYRWRFFDRDGVDCIVIEHQEYDSEAKVWKTIPLAETIFAFDDIESVHKAMLAVKGRA